MAAVSKMTATRVGRLLWIVVPAVAGRSRHVVPSFRMPAGTGVRTCCSSPSTRCAPITSGSYGYPAAQTPALDALAARGLRFEQATTVAPLTLPAHSSLMTGTFPAYHGVRDNGGYYLGDDQVTLAKLLRGRGYRTGGFISAFVLDGRWGIGQGFDRYFDDFDLSQYRLDVGLDAVQRPASEVVSKAIEWLDQDVSSPFLAWVHVYEPHAPYDPPEAFRARFPPTMIGAYDAEVATADAQIARLIDHLRAAGRLIGPSSSRSAITANRSASTTKNNTDSSSTMPRSRFR